MSQTHSNVVLDQVTKSQTCKFNQVTNENHVESTYFCSIDGILACKLDVDAHYFSHSWVLFLVVFLTLRHSGLSLFSCSLQQIILCVLLVFLSLLYCLSEVISSGNCYAKFHFRSL